MKTVGMQDSESLQKKFDLSNLIDALEDTSTPIHRMIHIGVIKWQTRRNQRQSKLPN